jgi:hypothetical protein
VLLQVIADSLAELQLVLMLFSHASHCEQGFVFLFLCVVGSLHLPPFDLILR